MNRRIRKFYNSKNGYPINRKRTAICKWSIWIWIGKEEKQAVAEIATLKELAAQYPEVIKAIIVGNEVLLRGDQTDVQLAKYIKEVKEALPQYPVTYADVWEFWLKYPKIKELTDFVTIHILPYWEDEPKNIHD